jgi:S-DNA-T family DNA segregation ATPase FtsK/SpoIIIE
VDGAHALSVPPTRLPRVIDLRLTLLPARDPRSALDLRLRAPSGSTVDDARPALLQHFPGVDPSARLSIDGHALSGSAPLGVPPLLDGVRLVAHQGIAPPPRPPAGLLELHVVAGPDAGHVLPLRPGQHLVGRTPGCALTVDDADLSRAHLVLDVSPAGLRLRDLGSTNGTLVDGVLTPPRGTDLRPGQRVRAGASTFVVRRPGGRPAATRAPGTGVVELARPPVRERATGTVRIVRPAPPAEQPAARFPWLAVLLPALACLPLAFFTRQPTFLLLGLTGPLAAVASAVHDRSGRRRQARTDRERWQRDDAACAEQVELALAAERTALRVELGDSAALAQAAGERTDRLWGNDIAHALRLVVGTGQVRSTVEVVGADPLSLTDAPVVVDLARVGHLGLAGTVPRRSAALRHLVLQLSVGSSPALVSLALAASDPARAPEGWWAWLPHLSGRPDADPRTVLAAVAAEVTARTERRRPARDHEGPADPKVVVVVDGTRRLADDPALAVVLSKGPAVGVHAVCLDDETAALPSACTAVLDLTQGATLTGAERSTTEGRGQPVEVDGVDTVLLDRVARALAPVRDVAPVTSAALPTSCSLSDLLPVDPTDPVALQRLWLESPRSTDVVLGAGAEGPFVVDLVRDGPHTLVAGTTGAGKSELLQTLVTSLAVANRPDELSFVLVDYKGGAAFRECADLPHVVGLVTDLDDALAARALTSLQAEVRRRERVLAAAGAADLAGYQAARRADPALPPVGRLVLVVDEFRVLADELPDLLEGFVRFAAVGRSLGIHLVLATQRPGGVVSADVRANVNLRIALRVRDGVDSQDVLDADDAARLPADVPGRALLRSGSGPLTVLQVALAGGVAQPVAPTGVLVERLGVGPSRSERPAAGGLASIVAATRQAAAALNCTPPPSPWQPPLPERVLAVDLAPWADRGPWGLVDDPEQQTRAPLTWDPEVDGHLAVSGSARSGRSTALLVLALRLARTLPPELLELHVVDAGNGGLGALAALPHTGSAILRADLALVPGLVRRLRAQVAERQNGLADPTTTVLLVDGWDALAEQLEGVDHGRGLDELLALLRDGEQVGLRAVVAGGRGTLVARVSALVQQRLVLATHDPTDLLLAGLPCAPTGPVPPGRARLVPGGRCAQVAWPGSADEVRAQVAEIGRRWPAPVQRLRVRALPALVRADEVEPPAIGLGGDAAVPVRLRLEGLVLVAGPPGSGRTTTLAALARSAESAGLRVQVMEPADVPAGLPGLAAGTGTCLVVDDVDRLDPDVDAALADLVERRLLRALIVAGDGARLATSYRGTVGAARRHRTGVLLQPRTTDGELLGVRLPGTPDPGPPGRGLLVVRGTATPVQIATSDDPRGPRAWLRALVPAAKAEHTA